jgi:alcohol dehydrogenase class IV
MVLPNKKNSEGLAERGLKVIGRTLSIAVADGKDLEAREGIAPGSLFASLSLAKSNIPGSFVAWQKVG